MTWRIQYTSRPGSSRSTPRAHRSPSAYVGWSSFQPLRCSGCRRCIRSPTGRRDRTGEGTRSPCRLNTARVRIASCRHRHRNRRTQPGQRGTLPPGQIECGDTPRRSSGHLGAVLNARYQSPGRGVRGHYHGEGTAGAPGSSQPAHSRLVASTRTGMVRTCELSNREQR